MTAQTTGHYFEVSTEPVAPHQRREFWGDVALNRSDPDFPDGADPTGFMASLRGYAGLSGSIRDGRTDAVIMHRTAQRCRADGGDEIQISAVIETDGGGVYGVNDREARYRTGDLVILDMTVPGVTRFARGRDAILRLPRTAVANAIGGEPRALTGHIMPATALVGLLCSQMRVLADALPTLDNAGREAGLAAASDLALATLRIECGSAQLSPDGSHWAGMWSAATRFVDSNLGDHDLNPVMIARALHCSRAYVFRLFARHEHTVMGYVQEARLQRTHRLLTDTRCRLQIAELAYLCGFGDPSAFSRSFRQRFGYLPRELRNGTS